MACATGLMTLPQGFVDVPGLAGDPIAQVYQHFRDHHPDHGFVFDEKDRTARRPRRSHDEPFNQCGGNLANNDTKINIVACLAGLTFALRTGRSRCRTMRQSLLIHRASINLSRI